MNKIISCVLKAILKHGLFIYKKIVYNYEVRGIANLITVL